MRACPTHAIRVRDGKAELLPDYCIDCGACLRVCPTGAIRATTQLFSEIRGFKHKVVVPSPVLFGQFPTGITPAHIVAGLKGLGFDDVWDISAELALVHHAVNEYIKSWGGPFPLISVWCPVVVRLIQVAYPSMVDQLIRVQPPREVAGRAARRHFAKKLGLLPEEIGAFYTTPCQAKAVSIHRPAEGVKSNLDGAIGISEVYNDILALTRFIDAETAAAESHPIVGSGEMLRWATREGQMQRQCQQQRHMTVTGLANLMQVFDDVEKEKLRNVEYLECLACPGGCFGGNLTVDNIYVAQTKVDRLAADLPERTEQMQQELERRYAQEDLSLKRRVRPREVNEPPGDLRERIARMKTEQTLTKMLPGIDCGLCGAPTCQTFAKDVAANRADEDECVFLCPERVQRLKEVYEQARKESDSSHTDTAPSPGHNASPAAQDKAGPTPDTTAARHPGKDR